MLAYNIIRYNNYYVGVVLSQEPYRLRLAAKQNNCTIECIASLECYVDHTISCWSSLLRI